MKTERSEQEKRINFTILDIKIKELFNIRIQTTIENI